MSTHEAMSLFLYSCPGNTFISIVFLYSTSCVNMQYLFFSFWLTSLCMTDSRSIHISANDLIVFLFMSEWYSIAYMYHISFMHSSGVGYLGYFHILAIVNSAAIITIGVYVSFWIMVLCGYVPRSGIAVSKGSSGFSFLSNLHTVLNSGCINLLPTNSARRFAVPHTLSRVYCL